MQGTELLPKIGKFVEARADDQDSERGCGPGPGTRIQAPIYRVRQDFDRSNLRMDVELESI
jgi:hypothetical protein